jgi:hypothetical protein
MSDRLAEIEARVERWEVKGTVEGDIDGEPWGVEGVVGIAVTMRESDYDWLLARIRELEAQAAADAKVVEAIRQLPLEHLFALVAAQDSRWDEAESALINAENVLAGLDAALAARKGE